MSQVQSEQRQRKRLPKPEKWSSIHYADNGERKVRKHYSVPTYPYLSSSQRSQIPKPESGDPCQLYTPFSVGQPYWSDLNFRILKPITPIPSHGNRRRLNQVMEEIDKEMSEKAKKGDKDAIKYLAVLKQEKEKARVKELARLEKLRQIQAEKAQKKIQKEVNKEKKIERKARKARKVRIESEHDDQISALLALKRNETFTVGQIVKKTGIEETRLVRRSLRRLILEGKVARPSSRQYCFAKSKSADQHKERVRKRLSDVIPQPTAQRVRPTLSATDRRNRKANRIALKKELLSQMKALGFSKEELALYSRPKCRVTSMQAAIENFKPTKQRSRKRGD